jgi:hypothetical protein
MLTVVEWWSRRSRMAAAATYFHDRLPEAIAGQLEALRWLGFVPEDLAAAPPDALTMLAETLDVSPGCS